MYDLVYTADFMFSFYHPHFFRDFGIHAEMPTGSVSFIPIDFVTSK